MARTFTVNQVCCTLILRYELRCSTLIRQLNTIINIINYLNFRTSVGTAIVLTEKGKVKVSIPCDLTYCYLALIKVPDYFKHSFKVIYFCVFMF